MQRIASQRSAEKCSPRRLGTAARSETVTGTHHSVSPRQPGSQRRLPLVRPKSAGQCLQHIDPPRPTRQPRTLSFPWTGASVHDAFRQDRDGAAPPVAAGVRPPPIPRLTRQVPSTPQQQGAVEFAEPTSSSPADMGCCAPPTALVARPLPVGGHPSSATPHVLSCRLTRHFGVGTGHHHRAGSRCSHRQVENFARPLQSCFLRVVPFGRAWSPGWRWPAWPRLYGVILSAETVVRAMSPGGGESQHLLLAEVGYEAVRCKTERLLRPERRRRRPWTALDGQERPAPKANPATYAALNGKPPARPSRGGAQIQAVLGALQLSDTWLRGPPVNASGWVV